jgi:V/A-type H+/Na+-transporting ATPase subunit D
MAVRFQYNKTSLNDLNRQLRVRVRALPTLKNKESALRMEVKRARDMATEFEAMVKAKTAALDKFMRLWTEFDTSLVTIKNVEMHTKKIAGVKIPIMGEITFAYAEFSVFNRPKWYLDGISIIEELAAITIEKQFYIRKMRILDLVRKKTTQKVNLYEKVQIPDYEDSIRKIKRFLEDEENLSKSGQKIMKNRNSEVVA